MRVIHKLRCGNKAPCGADYFTKNMICAGINSYYETVVLPRAMKWEKVTCKKCLEYKDLTRSKFHTQVPRD